MQRTHGKLPRSRLDVDTGSQQPVHTLRILLQHCAMEPRQAILVRRCECGLECTLKPLDTSRHVPCRQHALLGGGVHHLLRKCTNYKVCVLMQDTIQIPELPEQALFVCGG